MRHAPAAALRQAPHARIGTHLSVIQVPSGWSACPCAEPRQSVVQSCTHGAGPPRGQGAKLKAYSPPFRVLPRCRHGARGRCRPGGGGAGRRRDCGACGAGCGCELGPCRRGETAPVSHAHKRPVHLLNVGAPPSLQCVDFSAPLSVALGAHRLATRLSMALRGSATRLSWHCCWSAERTWAQ